MGYLLPVLNTTSQLHIELDDVFGATDGWK